MRKMPHHFAMMILFDSIAAAQWFGKAIQPRLLVVNSPFSSNNSWFLQKLRGVELPVFPVDNQR